MQQGDVVLSLFGHDKGRKYLIFSQSCDTMLCVDGKLRKLSNPKRKNIKHLELIGEPNQRFDFNNANILDAHIRKFLKNF